MMTQFDLTHSYVLLQAKQLMMVAFGKNNFIYIAYIAFGIGCCASIQSKLSLPSEYETKGMSIKIQSSSPMRISPWAAT